MNEIKYVQVGANGLSIITPDGKLVRISEVVEGLLIEAYEPFDRHGRSWVDPGGKEWGKITERPMPDGFDPITSKLQLTSVADKAILSVFPWIDDADTARWVAPADVTIDALELVGILAASREGSPLVAAPRGGK